MGHVVCGSLSFSIKCQPEPSPEVIRVFADRSEYDETCHLSCPASQSSFHLHGQLHYVHGETSESSMQLEGKKGFVRTADYPSLLGFLWNNLFSLDRAYTVLGTIFLCILCTFALYCVVRAYLMPVTLARSAIGKTHLLLVCLAFTPFGASGTSTTEVNYTDCFFPGTSMNGAGGPPFPQRNYGGPRPGGSRQFYNR